tara:strand:- start:1541 stop:2176 length:636 start_codon:yes stop_codon:yes gene_type:complete
MISIELKESIGVIGNKIKQAFAEEINTLVKKREKNILSQCKDLVSAWIISQPEVQSLNDHSVGSLAGQFGLHPGQDLIATKEIVDAVESSVQVKFIPFDKKLNGGFFVYFQPSNFQNLLSLGSGHVVDSSSDLHWLDWLLTQGDTIIVVGYSYNPESGIGRSGLGSMTDGGSFRIPPQFSGNVDNNFITRALIGSMQEGQIADIFKKELGI